MHIKAPSTLLNSGATATARFNYSRTPDILFSVQYLNFTNILERSGNYCKIRLDNAEFSKFIIAGISSWINIQPYVNFIIKITFDSASGRNKYVNFITSDKGKVWINRQFSLDSGNHNGYVNCKYVLSGNNEIFIALDADIGRADSAILGGTWIQLDTLGACDINGILEIETFNPFFNISGIQNYYSDNDFDRCVKRWSLIIGLLKPVSVTQTLSIGNSVISKLPEAVRSEASAKGWTLA